MQQDIPEPSYSEGRFLQDGRQLDDDGNVIERQETEDDGVESLLIGQGLNIEQQP